MESLDRSIKNNSEKPDFSYILSLRKKYGGTDALIKILWSYIVQLPVANQAYKFFYQKKIKSVIERRYLRPPRFAHIETYNFCNGGCVMCPYPQSQRPKEIMSMELFKKIIDDLKDNGFEWIHPDFYSDPFFDPYIFERIKYVKEKGMGIKIFTNGSLLNKEKVDKLFECPPDRIVISVDAVNPDTYKKIRTGLDLNVLKNNVKYLIEEKKRLNSALPKITTIFVLQDKNMNELEAYKKEWEGVVDRADVNVDNMFVKGVPKVFRHPFSCKRLFEMFPVMSNGKVALCCNDFDGKYAVGDFNKQNFKEIYHGHILRLYQELHKTGNSHLVDMCRECSYSYDLNAWKWWKL